MAQSKQKTFYRTSVSGVKITTPAVSTVAALDPIQVKTFNSVGGASEGEVELNPLGIRAKGDRELNAESEEFRAVRKEIEEIKASQVEVQAERTESPDNVNGEAGDKSGTGTEGAARCR